MYQTVIDHFAETAVAKARSIRENPLGFLVGAALAGSFIGIGDIFAFTLGQMADPSMRPLIMGATFGIALTLVVFAGGELFTGYAMYMALGLFKRKVSIGTLVQSWVMVWVGNLIGALILAEIFHLSGGGQLLKPGADLLFSTVTAKMQATPVQLLTRGILCNFLVCLALWMCSRTKDDTAKAIVIFWCLFAFVACGFEHSIANMTVFSIALLGPHPDTITLGGAIYNLFWVTLGNAIAGVVFVGGAYWLANGRQANSTSTSLDSTVSAPAE